MKLGELTAALEPLMVSSEYCKNGPFFRRSRGGLIQQVGFQSRRDAESGTLYTINLDATIEEIGTTDPPGQPLREPHYHQRVGFLMPEHRDLWWRLDGGPRETIEEAARLLSDFVVPEFDRVTPDAIVGRWLSDKGTGIPLAWERRSLDQARRAGLA